jgi:hypothetical protein
LGGEAVGVEERKAMATTGRYYIEFEKKKASPVRKSEREAAAVPGPHYGRRQTKKDRGMKRVEVVEH